VLEYEDSLLEFDKQYKKVCKTQKEFSTLEIHPLAFDYPYIFHKKPYYDDDGECIGMFGYNIKMEVFTLNDFVKGNMPGSLLLNKPDNVFTERDCEVMFFRLQGLSHKETATRLNLSPRTVENYMQYLYEKVGVHHFDDFMKFCVDREFHRYLPKRFISKYHLKF
jgi:DNA-binding CsgD family transcriptional regulator